MAGGGAGSVKAPAGRGFLDAETAQVGKQGRFRKQLDYPAAENLDKTGCHFHQRCPYAMARCKIEVPALREVVPGHLASCHLHDAGVRFPLARTGGQ